MVKKEYSKWEMQGLVERCDDFLSKFPNSTTDAVARNLGVPKDVARAVLAMVSQRNAAEVDPLEKHRWTESVGRAN